MDGTAKHRIKPSQLGDMAWLFLIVTAIWLCVAHVTIALIAASVVIVWKAWRIAYKPNPARAGEAEEKSGRAKAIVISPENAIATQAEWRWSDRISMVRVSRGAVVYLYIHKDRKTITRKLRLCGKAALKHGPWVVLDDVKYDDDRRRVRKEAMQAARKLLHGGDDPYPHPEKEAHAEKQAGTPPLPMPAAPERRSERSTIGVLTGHGMGDHKRGRDCYSCYYADVTKDDGAVVRVIGTDLERAINEAHAVTGHRIRIVDQGKTSVIVKENGEWVKRLKNLFFVERLSARTPSGESSAGASR